MVGQAIESRTQGPGAEFPEPPLRARVQELETENARLKSLVGELLVANQLLREKCRERGSGSNSGQGE
jgi:hypothetical protein